MTRFLVATVVTLVGSVALVGIHSVTVVAGQKPAVRESPRSGAGMKPAPMTPWGVPDLQGTWTGATLTRLERPTEFAGREFLTQAEIAALEGAATAAQFAPRPVDPQTGKPLTQGGVGDYNAEWFDNGTKVVPSRRTSLIVAPSNGKIPYTTEALKRQRPYGEGPYNSHIDLDTGERCVGDGTAEMVWLGYNPNHQIVQSPDHVVILHEMFRERRIVPLDGRPHVAQSVRQWNGDLRGHWEADTLVVESTNFVDNGPLYRWNEVWRAPSATLHMVERFRRTDAETMEYRVTITDPSKFTQPWTIETVLTTNQAQRGVTVGPVMEYACHEGNYGLANILRGARSAEANGRGTKSR